MDGARGWSGGRDSQIPVPKGEGPGAPDDLSLSEGNSAGIELRSIGGDICYPTHSAKCAEWMGQPGRMDGARGWSGGRDSQTPVPKGEGPGAPDDLDFVER